MRAAWWWIDRWRKSTAYTDMSAEAQGVYRNLLDELWLRDGAIPLDERVLRKVGGDWEAWPRVRETVMARFIRTEAGWRNETHDAIMGDSMARAKQQQNYRDRKKSGWKREIDAQGGLCGCCGATFEEPWTKYVVRDHCHATDRNRGLVCSSCNQLLGRYERGMRVVSEKLPKLVAYTERWTKRLVNVDASPSPSPSPSKDQSPKNETDSSRSAAPSRNNYPAHFEAFWSAYPSKSGKYKALAAWKRHVPPDRREAVIADIARHQRENPKWLNGCVHNPTTWLNGHEWESEFGESDAPDPDGEDMMARLKREQDERMGR